MDVRHELRKLPDPDPEAEARVWDRLQASRQPRGRWLGAGGAALALAAALALVVMAPEAPRTETLEGRMTWSDTVVLDAKGQGEVTGTGRDLEVTWTTGTIRAEVTPSSGTRLAVVTEEATVDVVGTVFSVTRDRLGVHARVERGKVKVRCADGWSGELVPAEGVHTCLPVRAALLLGRADALLDASAAPEVVLDTLDRGLTVATDPTVEEELRVRRMSVRAELGRVDEALDDARRVLDGPAAREGEVRRFAGRLALQQEGCEAALLWLDGEGALPEERVLLAECLAEREPARAGALLRAALPSLDPAWSDRASLTLDRLEAP